MRPKRCRYCPRSFIPDPRSYRSLPSGKGRRSKQVACSDSVCRAKRRRDTQKGWRRGSADYFDGREAYHRKWRENHKGYWKGWRKKHPAYVKKNRKRQKGRDLRRRDLAKQDSIDSVHREKLDQIDGLVDLAKQDPIRTPPLRVAVEIVRYLRWTNRLAKQDVIDLQKRITHNRGHEPTP